MQRNLEYFDEFLENGESLSDEEFLRYSLEYVEFIHNNIGKYGFTEEFAAESEKAHREFEEAYHAEKKAKRALEIADEKLAKSAAAYDEAMAEIMEKGGKPIPIYTNLPKRRN